ncbi:DUF4113 domain-containing protein [Aminobacter sp. P9b]
MNGRFCRETLRPGGMTSKKAWPMRRRNLSPSYTTRIGDVLAVRA